MSAPRTGCSGPGAVEPVRREKPPKPTGEAIVGEMMKIAVGGINLTTGEEAIGDLFEALRLQAQVLKDPEQYADQTVPCPKCKGEGEERQERPCGACRGAGVLVLKPSLSAVAKAMKATGDTADTTARLLEFAKGQPDSRPDGGTREYLRYLTDAELVELHRRIAAGEAKR